MLRDWIRTPHMLRRNKLTTVPKHFTSLACACVEHKSETNKSYKWYTLKQCALQHWWFANDKWNSNYVNIFDNAGFAWVCLGQVFKKRRHHYVVSPNLAQDLSVLGYSDQIKNGAINHNWSCLTNPPTIVEFTDCNNSKITAVDIRNFFKFETENVSILIDSGDDEKDNETVDCIDFQHACYLCNQCGHAFSSYLDFIRENDLGNFRPTVGGQSFNAFKHRFMRDKIMLHGHKEAVKLERQAFRGGRCEAFYYGKYPGKVYAIDCNGLYPYAMLHGQFPIKAIDHEKYPSLSNPIFTREDVEIVARVKVQSDRRAYPTVNRGRVCFANGSYTTVLCGREFREAWNAGHITSIGEYVAYLAAPIFKDYIEFFWNLRQRYRNNGIEEYSNLSKAFMVSLFGKFGQKRSEWIANEREWKIDDMGQWPIVNADTGEIRIARSINDMVEIQHKDGETDDSFPAISACVTSYARAYMDNIIDSIGRKCVLLQYIDSILLTEDGYNGARFMAYTMGDYIGQFKLAGEYDGCVIRSAYDYSLGNTEKICGIPKEARVDDVGNVVYGVKETENSLFGTERSGHFTIRDISGRLNRNRPVNYPGADGWLPPIRIEE